MKDRNPRRKFKCSKCGLRIEGKVNQQGIIVPYDGSPTIDSKTYAAICATCKSTES